MQSTEKKNKSRRKREPQDHQNTHYEKVYRSDRIARYFITAGGYGIIVSILAIMLFLIYQSLPLAGGASITEMFSVKLGNDYPKVLLTGIDSYNEIFYNIDENGNVRFYKTADQETVLKEKIVLLDGEKIVSASKGSLTEDIIALGTNQGRLITAEIEMTPRYSEEGREIIPSFGIEETWQAPAENDSIPLRFEKLVFRQNEDLYRFWSWVDQYGNAGIRIFDADEDEEYTHQLSMEVGDAQISAMSISYNGENYVFATTDGQMFWFDGVDFEELVLKEKWTASGAGITAVNYLLGDQAVVVGSADGEVATWFPVRTTANIFKFQKIHEFRAHKAEVTQIFSSPRNRNFLTIDKSGRAQLHYSTSGKTQASFKSAENPVTAGSFAPKSNALLVMDDQRNFGMFGLDNEHPESTINTLFGKVWYEGYSEPEFVWQSTGGTDEFEPKISLIPVIFGTLKGTLYAMLFSIPIAILAAIYVSQFAPAWLARSIKPTVEIMAALPSVVIGFLAGLYFSPIFEDHLITILMINFWLPVVFVIGIVLWRIIPEEKRTKFPQGWEILYMIPILVLTIALSWWFAKPIETMFFEGNFQQWLYATIGVTYETRNSLVVGFALGFAVIPIIFTMSEDSISNVPESLSSASLALGASRWQTVRRVVLPAASGGIFAAIMLGLGRAVGETMIVLMATGNTPILDINPFNGFRAMSASIAVEIPEAPVGGTLYRVLFLTALLLFLFTFVLNTLSSLIGDRLRKKYARF